MSEARGYLPYVLLPRFNNVISTIATTRKGGYMIPHEVYIGVSGTIHVASASSLVHDKFIKTSFEVETIDKGGIEGTVNIARVTDVEGTLTAFLPTRKRFINFNPSNMKNLKEQRIEIKNNEASDFNVNMIVRKLSRIEGGKILASIVKRDLEKDNWRFEKIGTEEFNIVISPSRGAKIVYPMKINIFKVSGNREFLSPGIIPAYLKYINETDLEFIDNHKVRGEVRDTVDRLVDLGKRLSDIALLQGVNSGSFNYVVGEVINKERLNRYSRNLKQLYITSTRVAKGVKGVTLVDIATGSVILSLKPYITSPPANIVMSYPPLYLAPLISVMNSQNYLNILERYTRIDARKKGLDVEIFLRELDPLRDARIYRSTMEEIRREGYPSLSKINYLLDELEKLGDISDIVAMTYSKNNLSKIVNLLLPSRKTHSTKKEKQTSRERIKL